MSVNLTKEEIYKICNDPALGYTGLMVHYKTKSNIKYAQQHLSERTDWNEQMMSYYRDYLQHHYEITNY